MAKAIARLPHECGTRQGLVVFGGSGEDEPLHGYCFRCETKLNTTDLPEPFSTGVTKDFPVPRDKTPEEIEEQLKEIEAYPVDNLPARKLGKKTLEYYNVRIGFSETDGKTPTEVYWPQTKDDRITGYKVKVLDSKGATADTFSVGDCRGTDLVGWLEAKSSGANRLVITEGEEDMASVTKVVQKYGLRDVDGDLKFPVAVVSLPRGSTSAKSTLERQRKEIENLFKDIILCFDQDEPGQKAVKDAMLILPRATSVSLPYKDANECIQKGVEKKLFSIVTFQSSKPKNTNLVFGPDLVEIAKQPPKWGELSWPWPTMNDLTRGIRLGETYYLGAGVKMGWII